jgi:hypothetical protein
MLRENALAAIDWQPVQWQAIVTSGGLVTRTRTWPQRHPPSQGSFQSASSIKQSYIVRAPEKSADADA